MKRFKRGLQVGALFTAGLYLPYFWCGYLETGPLGTPTLGSLLLDLIFPVGIALLVATAFAIRRGFLPIIVPALLVAYWWQSGSADGYWGWPIDGFFRKVIVPSACLVGVGIASVQLVRAALGRD